MSEIIKAQNLYGTLRRKSDRHKREGRCVIPGEICMGAIVLPVPQGAGRLMQKSAEAIVGARACSKGRTLKAASRQWDHTDSR